MQLAFFLSGYPNEPLYSIVARYHDALGYESYQNTTLDLFGRRSVSARVDLPQHIEALSTRLPWSGWSPPEVMEKHTAYAYYANFIADWQRKRLYLTMCSSGAASPDAALGTMAQNIKSPSYMRFCPECVRTDREAFGEAHWHRTHQLMGVLVCSTHGVYLKESTAGRRLQRSRNAFVSLEQFLRSASDFGEAVMNEDARLQAIAEETAYFVDNADGLIDLSRWQSNLLAMCRARGWIRPDGSLKVKTIDHLWDIRYPEEFCMKLQCGLERVANVRRMVKRLLFDENPNVPPLIVILVLRLLGHTFKSFLDLTTGTQMVTNPEPQPCINPVCPESATTNATEAAFSNKDYQRVIVSCYACDMQYSKYLSTGAVRYRRWGNLWDDQIRAAVTNGQETLRALARRMRVDTNTIRKHAERLGLQHPWSISAPTSSSADASVACIREDRQAEWLTLRAANPFATRKELRKRNAALWTWLYRNDRQWLDSHSPRKRRPPASQYRRNWQERDRQLCLDLMTCVRGMREELGKPMRITPAELARRVNGGEVLQVNAKDKLPKALRLLRRLKESRPHYAARRIEWAMEQYVLEGHEPEHWEVVRRAGIRSTFVAEVHESLEQALEKTRSRQRALEAVCQQLNSAEAERRDIEVGGN